MNEAQRQQLMRQMRGLANRSVEVFGVTPTRFDREITSFNLLDREKTTSDTVRTITVGATAAGIQDPGPAGSVKRDPMYDLEIEFSDNGDGFGNPLVNPVANAEYYVRCRIRQHQADPLVQGFKLAWVKPEGWTWLDGIGQNTIEEAVSNPLVATRPARAPATERGGKFRVVVLEKYL